MHARTSRGFCSTIARPTEWKSWRCRSMPSRRLKRRRRQRAERQAWRRSHPRKTFSEAAMESAIPPHLQVKRTRHRRVPDDYQPPYPAFVARHRAAVERVVMAYFGLQYAGAAPPAPAATLACLETMFAAKNGPKHWDRAACRDEAGYHNVVSVAYWDDQRTFEAWFPAARES